jgi:hypothetical protein
MSFKIMTRAEQVAGVPARWERQYERYFSHDPEDTKRKQAITSALLSLPDGFTGDEVDEIIGNTSWTRLACDHCGRDSKALVSLGDDPYVSVCARCLSLAVSALKGGRK